MYSKVNSIQLAAICHPIISLHLIKAMRCPKHVAKFLRKIDFFTTAFLLRCISS